MFLVMKRLLALTILLLAMVRDYGLKAVDPYSPTLNNAEFKDNEAFLTFNINSPGLSPIDCDLEGWLLRLRDIRQGSTLLAFLFKALFWIDELHVEVVAPISNP